MRLLRQRFAVHILGLAIAAICFTAAVSLNPGSNAEMRAKPSVDLQASKTLLTYSCQPGWHGLSGSCPTTGDTQVELTATISGFAQQANYVYTVNGGRIFGEGRKVVWDLGDARPGYYTAIVEVRDRKKHRAESRVNVTLQSCGDCVDDWPCPLITVQCYDQVKAATPITCKVVLGGYTRKGSVTFEWSTSDWSGEDLSERISGRGTSISIRTDGLAGRHLNTKVEVKGLDPSCSRMATGTTAVK